MKSLARWAARYGSPYPVASAPGLGLALLIACGRFCLAVLVCTLLFAATAYAAEAVATAPVGDAVTGGLVSLVGPALGVLSALVIFFDRLAKVIPNGTTSTILTVVRMVATVLGAKVQDKQ
jgi:hypothetical protein